MPECQCVYCPAIALNLQLCDVLVVQQSKTMMRCLLPKKGTENYTTEEKETICGLMIRAVLMGEALYGRGKAQGDYSKDSCAFHIKKVSKTIYKLCCHVKPE
jgi:hypothetical protein